MLRKQATIPSLLPTLISRNHAEEGKADGANTNGKRVHDDNLQPSRFAVKWEPGGYRTSEALVLPVQIR